MCKCKEKVIDVDVVLHSPYVTMTRKGDLIDLNYCGLVKSFEGEIEDVKLKRQRQTDSEENEDSLVDGIRYKKGAIFRVSLGFAMRMPEGKMAKMPPRSGTRSNYGVIMTNSVGQVDNAYQGTGDIWMAEFYAVQDGEMALGDRVAQFEIVDAMPEVIFNVVEALSSEDRGGYGSSGK